MRDASPSPTRMAARPGVIPRSANTLTRSAISPRIWAATARPSRIVAVTSGNPTCGNAAAAAPEGSVAEVPAPGDDDGDAELVGHVEHVLIPNASARMHDGRHAGVGGDLDGVGEGEERVARHDGAAGARPRLAGREERRVDPRHLAGADTDGREVLDEDDGVRLHTRRHPPREHLIAPLAVV